MGYDSHTIYRVHIKDQKKVFRVKDLRIFENFKTKASTELPDYDEGKPTFQGFFSEDNDEEGSEELTSTCDKSRKVDNAKGKQSTQIKKLTSTCDNGRKVGGIEGKLNSNVHVDRKVNDAEARSHAEQKFKDVMQGQSHADQRSKGVMKNQSHADQRSKGVMQKQPHANEKFKDVMKSCSGQTVKLSAKAREALSQDSPIAEKKPEVENLILYLTDLLNSWDAYEREIELQAEEHATRVGNDL